MLATIEARILRFPETNFNFPSTFVPRGTFLGPGCCWYTKNVLCKGCQSGKTGVRSSVDLHHLEAFSPT